jgi:hypothetical protein
MQRKDSLTVLRDHVIATDGQTASPGMKAVEIERALKRAGLTIISNEAMAAFACIVSYSGCTAFQFATLMQRLGLAQVVPFDPAKHDAGGEEIEPGSDFLEYSDALKGVLKHAQPHLRGRLQ